MLATIGAENLGLTSSATVNTPLGKSDTLVLKLKEVLNERARGQETPYPQVSSLKHADKACPMPDRGTVPGEKSGEKVDSVTSNAPLRDIQTKISVILSYCFTPLPGSQT